MALDIGSLVAYLELDESRFEKSAKGAGSKMPGWMAAAGALAGAAVAAAFAAAFVGAVNVDSGNRKVAAQLGLTEAESERAGAAAAGAYAGAFGDSMETVQATTAGVISSIKGMRDASVDELQGIVQGVQGLSDAFGIEADRISQVVGQMLSTGLAGSAEEGLDLLTTALQKVPAAVREDVLDAADEYGPFFAQMGIDGSQAMKLLVDASADGMYGIDKLGDAVKEFTIRATDGSKATRQAFDDAGLFGEDGEVYRELEAGLLAGGDAAEEAFQRIVAGLQGIEDPADQSAAAIALFGTPLEDLNVGEIPAFLNSLGSMGEGLGDVAGATDELNSVMGGGVAASWESLNRQFEVMMTTIASGLLPVLEPLLAWLVSNPTVIYAVAGAIGAMAAAWGIYTAAQWLANTAMFASPITWIILAIGALVAALIFLVANWDSVVSFLTDVWGGFISWVSDVIDGFVGWWNDTWSAVGAFIQSAWQGFVNWVRSLFLAWTVWVVSTVTGFQRTWNAVWTAVGQFFQNLWNGAVAFVRGIFMGWVTWLVGAIRTVQATWNAIWTAVGSFFRSLWQGAVSFVRGVIVGWVTWLTGAINTVRSWWNGLWSGVGSFFRSLWQGVVTWAVTTIAGFIARWRATWGALTGFFSGLWSGIVRTLQGAWNGALAFIRGIPGNIMKVFSGIGRWLWNAGRDLINGLLNGVRSLAGSIGSFFLNLLPDWIRGPFKIALGINSPSKEFRGYGINIGEGIMEGLDAIQPRLDDRMGSVVGVPDYVPEDWDAQYGPAPVEGARTFIYNAAENQSLSNEEALFAALGSPRSPFGGQ